MANILILGGGFGGSTAAEQMTEALGGRHRITLVSRHDRFTFYPALVRLAFGEVETEKITFDLAKKMRLLGARFVQGEALNINPQSKRVKIAGDDFNGEISYDYLLVAVGRRLATEKIGGFFEHSHHLLGVKAALKFRKAVERFTEGHAVVGLCPEARLPVPVCETAFALARRFGQEIAKEKIRVSVVFPESIKEAFGGAGLHEELTEAFEKHSIRVITDFAVKEFTADHIVSDRGERIAYDLPVFVPPFRGQTIVGNLRVASSGGVRIADASAYAKTDAHMQVQNMDGVYAAGDIVAFSGPKFAHMAVRQAKIAAENIVSEIEGRPAVSEYCHEIAAVIDQGGADSIYLHYGIWDDNLYDLKKGTFWSWAKGLHEGIWQTAGR